MLTWCQMGRFAIPGSHHERVHLDGHVEPGEMPEDALRRECLEEIGVVVRAACRIPMTTADPWT